MKYISAIIGGLLALASGYALWSVMQPTVPPHIPDRHLVYLFAGGVFFGALLIIPTVIVATLKSLFGVIGPYLPQVNLGRRSTDSTAVIVSPSPPATDKDK